jgi:hypothetical protein
MYHFFSKLGFLCKNEEKKKWPIVQGNILYLTLIILGSLKFFAGLKM